MRTISFFLIFILPSLSYSQQISYPYVYPNGESVHLKKGETATFLAQSKEVKTYSCIAEVLNNHINEIERKKLKLQIFQSGESPYTVETHVPFEINTNLNFSIKHSNFSLDVDISCSTDNVMQPDYQFAENQFAILSPGTPREVHLVLPSGANSPTLFYATCYHYKEKEIDAKDTSYQIYYEYLRLNNKNDFRKSGSIRITEKSYPVTYGDYGIGRDFSREITLYLLNLDVINHYVYCFITSMKN